jgi:MFS transporter, DHA1 family, tetracycline resistance protein
MSRTLLIAFFTVFLDLLGFGLIIPIQPFLAEAFGATPTVVTLLGASYSLMQFIFAPFWGRLSDRIGRRPVILTSVAISAIGYAAFGFAGSLPGLFAARMISGFGNANIPTAQAIIADTTSGKDRARGMGLIGAAFGLGFIFGPALGGILSQYSLSAPALAAGALNVANLIFAFFMLPETHPPEARQAAIDSPRLGRVAAARRLIGFHNIAWGSALALVIATGFSLMEQVLGLFIEQIWVPGAHTLTGDAQRDALRHAAALTSGLLVAIGITSTIVQGGLIGRLSAAFGELKLIRLGTFGLAISFALIPLVGHLAIFPLLFVAVILMAVSTSVSTPSLNSLLSRSAPDADQGAALGVSQSASSRGRVIGPATSGALFELHRNVPFVVGAALLFCAGLLSFMLRPAKDVEPAAPSTTEH